VESNLPVIGVYALVGGAGLKLEELAEGVMAAMERGEGIGLGFYDWGYPASATFWPTKLEDGDNVRPLRWTKVFIGKVGAEPHLPGCLTISQREGEIDAILTIVTRSDEAPEE
jgi:hypothetical protein